MAGSPDSSRKGSCGGRCFIRKSTSELNRGLAMKRCMTRNVSAFAGSMYNARAEAESSWKGPQRIQLGFPSVITCVPKVLSCLRRSTPFTSASSCLDIWPRDVSADHYGLPTWVQASSCCHNSEVEASRHLEHFLQDILTIQGLQGSFRLECVS